MIAIDPRAGSKDLLTYFKPYDVQVIDDMELDCGDIYFVGNGPTGTVTIGIEYKTIGYGRTDMVASMRDNRLSGSQIPKMLKTYDHSMLLVEGMWRSGIDGSLEVYAGKVDGKSQWRAHRVGTRAVLYRELSNYIVDLTFICGITPWFTGRPQDSAAFIVGLYKWWQKEWDEHDVQHVIYTGNGCGPAPGTRRGSFTRQEPRPVEEFASILPGIGKKAWEIGKVFHSPEEVMLADEKELQQVEGIGKKGAQKIHEWIHGRVSRP